MTWPVVAMSALDRYTRFACQLKPPERQLKALRPRPIDSIAAIFRLLLFFSLAASSAFAQASSPSTSASGPTRTLSISTIPAMINLPALNSTRPAIQLSFSATSDLFLTLNICSLASNTSQIPSVLISTAAEPVWALGSRPTTDVGSGGTREGGHNLRSRTGDLWSLTWDKGFGNWTIRGIGSGQVAKVLINLASGPEGSSRPVSGVGNVGIQLGVSSTAPMHRLSIQHPLLGDTTSTTALIFSPVLHLLPHAQPVYPNYTLPPAQLPLAAIPAGTGSPNLTLILVPTGSSPTNDGLDNSLCALRAANVSTGNVANRRNAVLNRTEPIWMRIGGEEGYRVGWGAGDLVPGGANYSAWVFDEARGELSRPVWLATKQAGFTCPLVLPTAFCPSIAYAAPLSPDPDNSSHPLTALPDNITSLITQNLNSLSTSLLSTACGRDRYSYSSSCADCHAAYRDWLCRILIPRCGTGVPSSSTPAPMVLSRTTDNPRVPGVPLGDDSYEELLPCLSTCNAVDRACPINLNFRCPLRRHGAARSYAFVGDASDFGDGSSDMGVIASDIWGNVWCNG